MFGKGLSLIERCAKEIPGPQTKHGRQGMFVKPTLFAQLECSRICTLHTVNAPALSRPEGEDEPRLKQQLRLVACHRLGDLGTELKPSSTMDEDIGIDR